MHHVATAESRAAKHGCRTAAVRLYRRCQWGSWCQAHSTEYPRLPTQTWLCTRDTGLPAFLTSTEECAGSSHLHPLFSPG